MSTELDEQRGRIADRMPQTTMLNNFERLVNVRTKAKDDFRLDILAGDLSESLPPQVRITSLTIRRQALKEEDTIAAPPGSVAGSDPTQPPGADSPDQALSLPELTQSKPFTIALVCHSEGSYTEVTTRFEKTAVALNNTFGVENLTWSYREEDKVGTLYCNLFPQQMRQNNEL